MKRFRKVIMLLAVAVVICLPGIASAYTVSWQDNGYGNDGSWYSMDAFTFVADNSGFFGGAPTVGGWTPGTVVNPNFAYITGQDLPSGDFNMSIDFQTQPIGATKFEYFGYVNGTAVKEGIIMFLSNGTWSYPNYAFADLGNAPRVPVPEPATMLLFGLGLLGLAGVRRKLKK